MPDDEQILPSEWLRRLAERRARDSGESAPGDFTETAAAAELIRRRVAEDIEKVKADLDGMLAAESGSKQPETAAPARPSPDPVPPEALDALRGELRAEVKKRTAKSERRLRKALRKEARAAGKKGARETADAAAQTLSLQIQAAEEELREHIHAQLSLAVQQARRRGEADARRDLERVLDRVLSELRSEGHRPDRL